MITSNIKRTAGWNVIWGLLTNSIAYVKVLAAAVLGCTSGHNEAKTEFLRPAASEKDNTKDKSPMPRTSS